MKTNKLMAAVMALLATGCSQNEITEVSPDANPAIGFGVYTGVQTKGQDMTTATMQKPVADGGGFGIMGYYTGRNGWSAADKNKITPSFMYNQEVTYDKTGSAWTYSPVKYWPNNTSDKVSFFAYAPYDKDGNAHGIAVSKITDTGTPAITFTLKDKDNLTDMVDLVIAKALDKTYNDGTISFRFEHTLSKISFKVKAGEDYADMDGTKSFIYVTKMWIIGANGDMSENQSLKNASSKFYTKAAWKDLHWDYTGATVPAADYDIKGLMNVDAGITEVKDDGTTETIYGVKVHSTTAKDLFKDKEFLYLIPVNDNAATVNNDANQGGCAEGDIQIGFHYDIVTQSASNASQYLASHAEAAVKIPAHHMKRNKAYIYTFTINLRKIEVSAADITAWGDAEGDFTVQ